MLIISCQYNVIITICALKKNYVKEQIEINWGKNNIVSCKMVPKSTLVACLSA